MSEDTYHRRRPNSVIDVAITKAVREANKAGTPMSESEIEALRAKLDVRAAKKILYDPASRGG